MQTAALVMKQAVSKYLLAAMTAWVPMANHYVRDKAGHFLRMPLGFVQEDQAAVRARYEATADDLADVVLDTQNESIFRAAEGRSMSGLLLASIASFEGGFQSWVDDGSCNTPEFQRRAKSQHRVECDGGAAFTIWQIHPEAGYAVEGGALKLLRFLPRGYGVAHPDDVVTGQKLIRSRRYAAQIAYYLVRYSEHQYHSLCAYTGEPCLGAHPLSDRREQRAKSYFAHHPFVPPAEAVLAQNP